MTNTERKAALWGAFKERELVVAFLKREAITFGDRPSVGAWEAVDGLVDRIEKGEHAHG